MGDDVLRKKRCCGHCEALGRPYDAIRRTALNVNLAPGTSAADGIAEESLALGFQHVILICQKRPI
jgi:hypothetical protein